MTELEQFKNVLAHPAFQNDPLGTLLVAAVGFVPGKNVERSLLLRSSRAGAGISHTCLVVGCTHAAIIKEHLKNKVAAVNSEREASNPRKVVPRHLQPKPQSAKPGSGGSGGNHNAKKSNIGKNKAGRGGKGRK